MKKNLITLILFLTAFAGYSVNRVQDIVNEYAMDSVFRCASIGVSIYDIEKNQEISGFRSHIANIPASTTKTITFATALSKLGPDFNFNTEVVLLGKTSDGGKFRGIIRVIGGGDPSLDSKYLKQEKTFVQSVIEALQAKGIKEIEGDIEVMTSDYNDSYNLNWGLDDIAYEYGTGAYKFNYYDNSFVIPVTIDSHSITYNKEEVEMYEMKLKDELHRYSQNSEILFPGLNIIRPVGEDQITLGGYVKNGKKHTRRFYCSIAKPDEFFKNVLKRELSKNNIKYKLKKINKKKLKGTPETLLVYCSLPLSKIAESALHRSDNMFTECVLRAMGVKEFGVWNGDMSVGIVKKYWKEKGLDVDQLFMSDGSGLARKNKITASFISAVLSNAYLTGLDHNIDYQTLFPQAGKTGTVKVLLDGSDYAGKFAVKSGSMGDVLCYAGYFPTENPKYTITLMQNNYLCSNKELRKRINAMLEKLFPVLEHLNDEIIEKENYEEILKNSKILNEGD